MPACAVLHTLPLLQILDLARASRTAMAVSLSSEPSRTALVAQLTVKREKKGDARVRVTCTRTVLDGASSCSR